MIDKTQAIQQLERLSGLDFFPKEKPAKKELVLALQSAITEDIAAQFVSDWLAESNTCPKPAEIRRAINAAADAAAQAKAAPPSDIAMSAVTAEDVAKASPEGIDKEAAATGAMKTLFGGEEAI